MQTLPVFVADYINLWLSYMSWLSVFGIIYECKMYGVVNYPFHNNHVYDVEYKNAKKKRMKQWEVASVINLSWL